MLLGRGDAEEEEARVIASAHAAAAADAAAVAGTTATATAAEEDYHDSVRRELPTWFSPTRVSRSLAPGVRPLHPAPRTEPRPKPFGRAVYGAGGWAVQVDPIKPTLNLPELSSSKPNYDKPLSKFAFKFNLRRYKAAARRCRTLCRRGRAVQVDPTKPALKAPGSKPLELIYDGPLSNFAFNFNLRRYTVVGVAGGVQRVGGRRRRVPLLAHRRLLVPRHRRACQISPATSYDGD